MDEIGCSYSVPFQVQGKFETCTVEFELPPLDEPFDLRAAICNQKDEAFEAKFRRLLYEALCDGD